MKGPLNPGVHWDMRLDSIGNSSVHSNVASVVSVNDVLPQAAKLIKGLTCNRWVIVNNHCVALGGTVHDMLMMTAEFRAKCDRSCNYYSNTVSTLPWLIGRP